MKKILLVIFLSFILVGCGSSAKWYEPETIEDIYYNEKVESDVVPFGQTVNFEGLDITLTKYRFPASITSSSGKKILKAVDGAEILHVKFEITNNNEDEVTFGSALGTKVNEFLLVDGNDLEGYLYENIVDSDISETVNGITIDSGETEICNVYFHVLDEFTAKGTEYLLGLTFLEVFKENSYIYFEFQ